MRILPLLLIVAMLTGCSTSSAQHQLDFASVELSGESSTASKPEPSVSEAPEEPNYAVDRSAEIEIEDQSGSGSLVQIEEIRVGRSNTFLVIYDSEGLVLASTLVSPQSQPVNVELERPLNKSSRLEAVLYLDDGDGQFEIGDDSPLIDDEGELVHEDFYYTLTKNG
jgi:hypothetical protein